MKGGNQLRSAVVVGTAAQARNRIERSQERTRGERPQGDDHFRFDGVDLPEQKWLAGIDFVLFRVPVLRRPALDHVRNVHIVTRQTDRLDDFREQLPGAADKGNSLFVFVGAGCFADEHQVRVWISDAEDDLLSTELVQLAAATVVADVLLDGGERFAGNESHRVGNDGCLRGGCLLIHGWFLKSRSPRRILARSGYTKFRGEFQMFDKLIAHGGNVADGLKAVLQRDALRASPT